MTARNAMEAPYQNTPIEELRTRLDEPRTELSEAHAQLQQLEEEWRAQEALCTTLRSHIHAVEKERDRRR